VVVVVVLDNRRAARLVVVRVLVVAENGSVGCAQMADSGTLADSGSRSASDSGDVERDSDWLVPASASQTSAPPPAPFCAYARPPWAWAIAAYFGPAIIAALVGGDIVANEDGGGTLKTILVRSVRRGELLAAKALALFTYVVVALVVFAVTGVNAGTIAWGFHPLANISGTRISAPHALGLTFAAIAVYTVPTIAIASFALFLSVVTRQSVAAVVGTIFYALALEGLAALPAIKGVRPYILVTQLHAWHGPFQTPTNWALIGDALWVSACTRHRR
jgi:ABC-2 type transport system permease protein